MKIGVESLKTWKTNPRVSRECWKRNIEIRSCKRRQLRKCWTDFCQITKLFFISHEKCVKKFAFFKLSPARRKKKLGNIKNCHMEMKLMCQLKINSLLSVTKVLNKKKTRINSNFLSTVNSLSSKSPGVDCRSIFSVDCDNGSIKVLRVMKYRT